MPCNCDHLEPTYGEVTLSKIACLLDEIAGKKWNPNHWEGMHPKVYSQSYDKYASGGEQDLERELVEKIMTLDVSKYSLEMQIWWRDYLKSDKRRKAVEKRIAIEAEEKKVALAKLTDREKKLLGL